jgi:serine phosphatase RsbU (regulator of sigma subunit)
LHFDDLAREVDAYPELARRYIIGSGRHAVSWLGVPLLNRDGAPIGVINVQSYRPAMFSARDALFLLNVAGQVALHVQNVSLLAHRERQIRELDAIGQISQYVSSAISLEAMLQPVYRVLQETTGASSFFLIICEPEQHRIRHAYYIDGGEEIQHDWPDGRPPSQSLTSWILVNGRPLLFDDLHTDSDVLQVVGAAPVVYGSDERPRSWGGVPLLDSDARPIGVIAIQDGRAYQYDRQTIAFLSQVALHISLGVQKAELFAAERAARRTADTLREVARVLSSTFDPDEVLDIILRELQNVVPYDTASIMLLEGDGLRVVAMCGWDQAIERTAMFPLNQSSAAVRVVRERSPMVISDTRHAPEWHTTYPLLNEIRSWLGVPLVAKGRVLGVLNIDSRRPERFLPRDVEVALTFASQAAVSLENARLYAESITRVEQELVIARQIQSNLFPHDLPQVVGLQLAARCLPARETGGDFYDCFILNPTVSAVAGWASMVVNQQGILALMVGDASGKSITGAMLMAVARSVARSEARDHIEPAAVMCETNQLVALDVPRGSFVALTYATIDLHTRRLALASAGQIAPIRRRRDGRLEELLPSGPALPLGIRHETAYVALEIDLSAGDTLVFFTDGLIEAHDPARHMFGFERVEQLIREYGDRQPEELIEILLDAVYAFIGPTPQHDDITVLVVKVL